VGGLVLFVFCAGLFWGVWFFLCRTRISRPWGSGVVEDVKKGKEKRNS
jgi:hypothetical protein